MSDGVVVLGISGSLRKGSFNTALLRAAVELTPRDVRIETADISGIPPYNEDVRTAGFPPAVVGLRDRIERADAILFVTPEYNYSVPGVLKNAIDWCSRPPNQPFAGKPLGLMGASSGMGGTMRAQYHLRQTAVFLDMHPLNRPEVFVRNAQTVFDDAGKLVDEPTRAHVRQFVEALAAWTRRLQR
jgi:chromate reductase